VPAGPVYSGETTATRRVSFLPRYALDGTNVGLVAPLIRMLLEYHWYE
jgi:hypothetical protein